jgi:hypothetical protein
MSIADTLRPLGDRAENALCTSAAPLPTEPLAKFFSVGLASRNKDPNMSRPSQRSLEALRTHGVPVPVVDVATTMTDCILQAADDMAADTRDESFDDPTSRGGLLYRRAHNRIVHALSQDRRAVVDRTDNALHVRVGGTAISFYSARNGLDNPSLTGSTTKKTVVDEMQMMLPVGGGDVRRLVLMHESDEDGAVRVALGVMQSPTSWSWRVTMFDRYALEEQPERAVPEPAYDELPEATLPAIERRDDELDQSEEL